MRHYISIIVFLSISLNSSGQYTPLTFNFDTIEKVYIDTSINGNIWQIGRPQKTIFNSAFNGQRAILTDTINFYPNNNLSEFIIKTPTYMSNWGGIEFYFRHKFDTDTLIDGGTIEVSYDGINWENILTSPALFIRNNSFSMNDTVSSLNEPGFSGQSKNWKEVHYFWNYPPTDTIRVKFKFASDNTDNNREGWMIDSLYFEYNLGIGIAENNFSLDNFVLYPNPSADNSTLLFNNKNSTAHELTLINSTGQAISTINNITADHFVINNKNIPNGIYFFILKTTDKKVASGKLIIER